MKFISDRQKSLSSLLVAIVLMSALIGAMGTATAATNSSDAPNPNTHGEVVIESYNVSWGTDPIQYEADDGDIVDFPGGLNESVRNPVTFTATDIEAADYGTFPRVDGESGNSVSALEASEWSKDVSGSAGSATIASTETAPGVEAVQFSTSSQTSGDVARFSFSNFSIKSDENKRYLQLGMDVHTLDSAADVDVRVVDANGDYKAAELNASRSSGSDLIATAQGEGYIYQHQLGKLDLVSAGDGTFDNIQKVEIVVSDGNADISVAALNVEKMGEWKLGTERADNDSDDEFENVAIREVSDAGSISVKSIGSMGSTFDDAVLHDVTLAFEKDRAHMNSSDIVYDFNVTNQRPGYHGVADIYLPTGLPTAYDISYQNLETSGQQTYLESRYITVEYAEGVGDTDPANVSSWSELTSSYSNQGANVTIDSTIQPGQNNYAHYRLQLQENEFTTAKNALESGGAVVMGPGGAGGGLGNIPILGGLLTTLGGIWAWAKNLFPWQG